MESDLDRRNGDPRPRLPPPMTAGQPRRIVLRLLGKARITLVVVRR